jgi:hypothetical protein
MKRHSIVALLLLVIGVAGFAARIPASARGKQKTPGQSPAPVNVAIVSLIANPEKAGGR